MTYVADTNVLSELMKERPNRTVIDWFWDHQGDIRIPSVAIEEIYYGIELMSVGKKQKRLRELANDIIKDCAGITYDFDGFSAYLCARLRAKAKRMGRTPDPEDLMIAAITERHSATLATRNVKDFDYLGVTLVNPFEPRA